MLKLNGISNNVNLGNFGEEKNLESIKNEDIQSTSFPNH